MYGVEPICKQIPIASSTYYEQKRRQREPEREPLRVQRDRVLMAEIRRVWKDNRCVYGVRKVWNTMKQQGITVARCTVARLMRSMGLHGVVRGKKVRTTIVAAVPCPDDLVQRDFTACRPDQLWVADFTYVRTHRGFVYTAFVVDVYSRMIVGWNVSASMKADLVLAALNQAIWDRQCSEQLVHHSDRGKQYLSVAYSNRLQDADIVPSVGSSGDSYALAETIHGLYKAEVIHKDGPWHSVEQVELATLDWVAWYNRRRIMKPLGYISPQSYEMMYYEKQEGLALCAGPT